MWTVDSNREMVRQVAPGLQQTSVQKLPLDTLHHKGISRVLLRYNQASVQDIRYASALLTNTCSHLQHPHYTIRDSLGAAISAAHV